MEKFVLVAEINTILSFIIDKLVRKVNEMEPWKGRGEGFMRTVLIVEKDSMARKLMEIFISSSGTYKLVSRGSISVNLILVDMATIMDSTDLEYIESIKKKDPSTKMICMTDLPVASYFEEARELGADSFWYKEPSQESLIHIMDRTMEGESVYPVSVPVVEVGETHSDAFTKRELQVLAEVVNGKSDAEIAVSLHLSIYTVKQHIQKIREKTKTVNRTDLAVCALHSGIATRTILSRDRKKS